MSGIDGKSWSPARYTQYLVLIAGMGGLLYGIDVGIIAAALLYLGKTVSLTLGQTSAIVAAVLGGGMASSLVAGLLADWLGRKKMMIASGFLFLASVGFIVLSQGFVPLFCGRLLQGLSGGVIAVVVPLFLAETLGPETRGRGSAIFQLMLTIGIVVAAAAGWFYTQQAETAIAAAAGDAQAIFAAENHAWRGMFLSVLYPGLVFFAGCFLLSETPRWLFRKGRREEAMASLRRSSPEQEALLQMREMEELAAQSNVQAVSTASGSLLQRKYVVPFAMACVILACNQATGINSILSYLVIILKQAGMTAQHATQGDVAVKLLNCLMTVIAVALIDKKGRKFLLVVGTSGIIVALALAAMVFHSFESRRVEMTAQVQADVRGNALMLPVRAGPEGPMALTVLYAYGKTERVATILSGDGDNVMRILPAAEDAQEPLAIHDAYLSPVPPESTGWWVTACIALFIASFSIGPGVVVWLALSELMPTRIRSSGMGFALLINQGVSTLIAGVFLPVVGKHGYAAMFAFWAVCTVIYFITAAFFLPETKGKTLEEIERLFEAPS
jgi:SP family myo-inositol transporter-like MFS transporter 13